MKFPEFSRFLPLTASQMLRGLFDLPLIASEMLSHMLQYIDILVTHIKVNILR